MTQWIDNALYRGALAGCVTHFVGSCIGMPAVYFVARDKTMDMLPWAAGAVTLASLLVATCVAIHSRRRDRPAQWRGEGKCAKCGYDLTGNVSGRCPECGAPAS